VTLTRYAGCSNDVVVELYSIAGAGHVWPGAPKATKAISAGEAMWAFFQAHPRP
jgi:polyhydroxybutyrate depolymerase